MKYVILTDTGGHYVQLVNTLQKVGVNIETKMVPKNVTIIHLGDLIHKGPQGNKIVDLVDQLLTNNPNNWVQLLGNHEFHHIKDGLTWADCECDLHTLSTISRWWDTKQVQTAYGLINVEPSKRYRKFIKSPNGSWLLTHAGVSHYWWKTFSGSTGVVETAHKLNQLTSKQLAVTGKISGYHGIKPSHIWAIAEIEVYPTWLDTVVSMPFNQVSGHAAAYTWQKKQWFYQNDNSIGAQKFRNNTTLLHKSRTIITELPNKNVILTIDPDYTNHADTTLQPYFVLETVS